MCGLPGHESNIVASLQTLLFLKYFLGGANNQPILLEKWVDYLSIKVKQWLLYKLVKCFNPFLGGAKN
jgi:hypothetical protein